VDVVELYLYAGFAAGWLVGRWRPSRSPWVGRATLGAVVALLLLLGASFRGIAPRALATTLPWAIAFATLLLGATAVFYLVLPRSATRSLETRDDPAAPRAHERVPTSGILVIALLVGYGVGRVQALPTGILIPGALTALLALVGYGIDLRLSTMRRAWVPIASAVLGALAAAVVLEFVGRVPGDAAYATALGFGWYSLTGPLVTARLGASLGLLAFLANFLREALTMLLAPYVGPRLKGEGLAALGGATAMDTTLYFVVRYGDRRAGALSVASGLTLTVAAGLIVPLVLAL
jgi:uncharacterized membrane protein YbjE (DUF340 family)